MSSSIYQASEVTVIAILIASCFMLPMSAAQKPPKFEQDEQIFGELPMEIPLFPAREHDELLRFRRQSGVDQSAGSGPLSSLSNFGAQLQQAQDSAKMFTSLFGGANNQAPQTPGGVQSPSGGGGGAMDTMQLMGQLNSLIRSTQERNAKMVSDAQRSAQQVGQNTAEAAQKAQGGITAALSEIGSGLQRIASNNPNLVPDVKQLYQSVSTKLSSASNSVAQATSPLVPKSNEQQLADSLSKAIANPSA